MTSSGSSSNKVVTLITLCLFFFSCSNNLNQKNLIGKWKEHMGCGDKDSTSTNVFGQYLEFLPNDSFTSLEEIYKKSKGTWSLDDKELTLNFDSITSLTFPIDTFSQDYFHFTIDKDSNLICIGSFERLEDNLAD